MFRFISFYWRALCTGPALAVFFVGGCLLAATVFPVLALWPMHAVPRTQAVIRRTFQLYLLVLRLIGLLRIEITGRHQLAACRGRLIIANHPTLLDVVLLMAYSPRAFCIVKPELWHSFFLRGVMKAAGYVRSDLPADQLIAACRRAFERGGNLIVFPEGTRSRPGRPLRFKRGFANIALLADVDVRMVAITCTPLTLIKGEPWYRIPADRPVFHVEDRGDVGIDRFKQYPHRGVGARRLVGELESLYESRFDDGRTRTRTKDVDRDFAEARGSVA
ncbi:1-acyl-sn-glycerol-3-phosphate acyltransferase [Reyranella sp. CPCC 100927]|uniref:lysophospholipid acyltransferase family protein n=1 Tax=Reyranella sp. CPCC 100927 TaxID=2599616 RepID=UPI0011B6EC54|nr:lysophospholipid acyltransferase family protein [Reyranella sp. CPCC 100927]TWT13700.1 1-acyl-sn-glycerol-3-phosphate acyltransferase [Reyranella sp. CPCC 100927]